MTRVENSTGGIERSFWVVMRVQRGTVEAHKHKGDGCRATKADFAILWMLDPPSNSGSVEKNKTKRSAAQNRHVHFTMNLFNEHIKHVFRKALVFDFGEPKTQG